jgi:tetratricopeptide (TPR) repeat protein
VSRHKAAVAASAFVVIALIVSTIVSLVYYRTAAAAHYRAEARFNDVRELARFVLFDFDQAISSGTTPARKALIERALDYLRRIEAEPGRDASLTAELVDGYLKMGDLQGNLYGPNLGDAAAARTSYESALRIAQSARPPDHLRVARAQVKLADLLAFSGQRNEAVERFREAYKLFEQHSQSDPNSSRTRVGLLRRIAFAEYQMGDLQAALRDYQASLSLARKASEAQPSDPANRREFALGLLRTGEMQARLGQIDEGLPLMKEALRIYEQMAEANPESAGVTRNIGMTSMLIGDVLMAARNHSDAAQYFRRAMELSRSLSTSDPQNEQYRRDLHNSLGRLADALARIGQKDEARSLTREALSILRPLAQKPDASQYDLHQYAWLLVASPVEELRDAATGRSIAETLVARTKGGDASVLDLLARAYAGSGDYQRAEETERRALALLPAGTRSDLRAELESNLAAFQSQASQKRARSR